MRVAAWLILSVVWSSMASAQVSNSEPQSEPPATPAEPAPAVAPAGPGTPESRPPKLRDLCRQAPPAEGELIEETRQVLEETFCGATLWFDGLFGGEADVRSARQTSGRVELSTLYTEFEGIDVKGRLRLRYDLPNLERRVNIFLGRDDRDEFVEDRREGFAVRSSVFGLETQEKWLAGLGYSPPGRWASKVDFRVGARVKSSPEVFAQTRYRRNVFVGSREVWRFRETVFWENREGFGSTTSLDFDHVLRRDLLLRWGNVGTFSESTEGVTWRSAALAYHNLRQYRAVAGELFVRGATRAEVKLQEYGTRAIYRQPVGKPYLFGELVVGYTWPRFERDEPREGSAMIGLGIELLFGREPY
ncbi:MAG TPA: hypothetical protein VGX68_17585 [Thermoanaerobaculia bacterium]|jgi:hypothetical protein|nr:hypothetical protein [Thermoanaerobaculia bacterium]